MKKVIHSSNRVLHHDFLKILISAREHKDSVSEEERHNFYERISDASERLENLIHSIHEDQIDTLKDQTAITRTMLNAIFSGRDDAFTRFALDFISACEEETGEEENADRNS